MALIPTRKVICPVNREDIKLTRIWNKGEPLSLEKSTQKEHELTHQSFVNYEMEVGGRATTVNVLLEPLLPPPPPPPPLFTASFYTSFSFVTTVGGIAVMTNDAKNRFLSSFLCPFDCPSTNVPRSFA